MQDNPKPDSYGNNWFGMMKNFSKIDLIVQIKGLQIQIKILTADLEEERCRKTK